MKAKDVLHFYLGQKFLYKVEGHEWSAPMELTADQLSVYYKLLDDPDCEYKLILRPLSSMTKEELKEWAIMAGTPAEGITEIYLAAAHKSFMNAVNKRGVNAFVVDEEQSGLMFKMTFFLVSKGFDIFGLHDSGECLYESDLPQTMKA